MTLIHRSVDEGYLNVELLEPLTYILLLGHCI